MKIAATVALFVLASLSTSHAADVREREPDPAKAAGKVYEWKSKDGVAYHYFIPRNYDAEKGANLTFNIRGSNLTRSWASPITRLPLKDCLDEYPIAMAIACLPLLSLSWWPKAQSVGASIFRGFFNDSIWT